jgi:hypothetical protein
MAMYNGRMADQTQDSPGTHPVVPLTYAAPEGKAGPGEVSLIAFLVSLASVAIFFIAAVNRRGNDDLWPAAVGVIALCAMGTGLAFILKRRS